MQIYLPNQTFKRHLKKNECTDEAGWKFIKRRILSWNLSFLSQLNVLQKKDNVDNVLYKNYDFTKERNKV